MKVNIYRYLALAAFSFAAIVSSAQDLDPTVVVDRAYEGKLVEVHKPAIEMAVPDSVMRFDLDFDYSVFDSPYKGSYEFNPYLLSMKPSASSDGSRKFYLRAGAGYQLHPELDLIWSPDLKTDDFSADVFARHRSFIGNYLNLDGQGTDEVWKGYDLASSAGLAGHGDWESGCADFWGKYSNLAVKDRSRNRMYNAVEVGVSVGSKDIATAVDYRVDAKYMHGHDAVKGLAPEAEIHNENVLDVDASVGFPVRGSMLFFDVEADYAGYGGQYSASMGQFGITPHYVYRRSRFMADVGVKVAKAFGNDEELIYDTVSENQSVGRRVSKEQVVYPDVTLEFGIIRDALKFRVHAGGGNYVDTYSSVLERNHHAFVYNPDLTIERLNVTAGFEGCISSRFTYNIYGGFVNYANGLLDQIGVTVYGDPEIYGGQRGLLSSVGHASYRKVMAGVDFLWKSESLMVDGSVVYSDSEGEAFDQGFVRPAALSGDVAVEYNWKRRVIAGADCRFATVRQSTVYTIPGYADLGLYLEYATSRGISFWAKGGNLLGMNIQYNPLYAQKGAYFTLGICLNL